MEYKFLAVADRGNDRWLKILFDTLAEFGTLDIVTESEAIDAIAKKDYIFVILDETDVESVKKSLSEILVIEPTTKIYVASGSATWKRARTAFEAGAMDYIDLSVEESQLASQFRTMYEEVSEMRSLKGKVILLADNVDVVLKPYTEILKRNEYKVIPVSNPNDARRAFEKGEPNLAILDIRLEDDDDDYDESGIQLAREFCSSIPVIILTQFPTLANVRAALKKQYHLPPAVEFIYKGENQSIELLLHAIQRALLDVRE